MFIFTYIASAMETNNSKFSPLRGEQGYDIDYLEVLFQKLNIELLKLETKGDREAFRINCTEILEKIRKELE